MCGPDHPNPTTPRSRPCCQRSTRKLAAHEPRHYARNARHQPDRSPATTLAPTPPHQARAIARANHAPNHPCSPPGGALAGANSGASHGSPIARNTGSIDAGSWIAASSRLAPPHRGHRNTSIAYTRHSNSAHL